MYDLFMKSLFLFLSLVVMVGNGVSARDAADVTHSYCKICQRSDTLFYYYYYYYYYL
jgi:hypothetical protein